MPDKIFHLRFFFRQLLLPNSYFLRQIYFSSHFATMAICSPNPAHGPYLPKSHGSYVPKSHVMAHMYQNLMAYMYQNLM